jgi:hypothetical protein
MLQADGLWNSLISQVNEGITNLIEQVFTRSGWILILRKKIK